MPDCKKCLDGFESATIHADCLSLFSSRCTAKDKYRRLWAASLAMTAWQAGSSLLLPPQRVLDREISFVDDALGTNMLTKLPPEIACMVLDLLGPYATRRYSVTAEQAAKLSLKQTLSQTLKLPNIQNWERDGSDLPLICHDSPDAPPYMRICIDSNGIRQIERIPNPPIHHKHCNSLRRDRLFIIERADLLTPVEAQFQVCSCFTASSSLQTANLYNNSMDSVV